MDVPSLSLAAAEDDADSNAASNSDDPKSHRLIALANLAAAEARALEGALTSALEQYNMLPPLGSLPPGLSRFAVVLLRGERDMLELARAQCQGLLS